MRTERDFLGQKKIPEKALYGIHSVRAKENFPSGAGFNNEWYKAMASVKLACYITAGDFYEKASEQLDFKKSKLKLVDKKILTALTEAARECEDGAHYEEFIVPSISGGAGTSINMNMNEILCNLASIKLGKKAEDYSLVDPIEHANIFQSTNDVVPTALRVAAMRLLIKLEEGINDLRQESEKKEKEYRNVLRIGYTQMQEAVPSSFGKLFSTYNDMLSRDWWRVSKCHERIKVVNLGGSAIGTSVTVPRYFVSEVVRVLQDNTNLPVTRGENLSDATSNLDSIVEVHGILKAHAVNLEKMVNDLRLLASDLSVSKLIELPQKQVGSSIMPAKINPVIPEYVISCCHVVYANDQLIASLASQGCLELNAYIPVIGDALLRSIEMLIACDQTLTNNLMTGLQLKISKTEELVLKSPSVATILLPYIGYNKSTELAKYMKDNKVDIHGANKELKFIKETKLRDILKPENLARGGYSIKDLMEND